MRLLVVSATPRYQLPDRGDPPRRSPRFLTREVADRGHYRRITRRPQPSIEHMFEYATSRRQESSAADYAV